MDQAGWWGENGFTPSLAFRVENVRHPASGSSHGHTHNALPCPWLPPDPCVRAVHLSNGRALLCFISGAAVFQNPTLQRPQRHRPTLIFWGRVSLCCGWCWLVPEGSCGWRSWFTVNHNTRGRQRLLPSADVSIPTPVSWAAQWYPQGPSPVERPCHLFQMHSKLWPVSTILRKQLRGQAAVWRLW